MGAPLQQSDWHLFAVLEISNSAYERGETKISPGCYSTRYAVLHQLSFHALASSDEFDLCLVSPSCNIFGFPSANTSIEVSSIGSSINHTALL